MIISWLKKILFVFVIAMAGLWLFIETPWGQRLIKIVIERALCGTGVDARIEHVDIALPFYIKVEGLTITDPAQSDCPLITCQSLVFSPLFVDIPFHALTFCQVRGQGIFIDADAIEHHCQKSASTTNGTSFHFSLAFPYLRLRSVHIKSTHLPNGEGACDCSLKGSFFLSSDQMRGKTSLSISRSTPCSWPKRIDLCCSKKQCDYALNTRIFLSTAELDHPKNSLFGSDDYLDLKINASFGKTAPDFSLQSVDQISGSWHLSCPTFSTPLLDTKRAITLPPQAANLIKHDALKNGSQIDFEDYILRRSGSARGELHFVPGKTLSATCDEFETNVTVGRTIQTPPDLDGAPELQNLQFEPIRTLVIKGTGNIQLFSAGTTSLRCVLRIPQISINEIKGFLESTIDFSLDENCLRASSTATGVFSHNDATIPLHFAGNGTIGPETLSSSLDLVAAQFRLSAKYDVLEREKSLWTTLRCQDLSIFRPFVNFPCGGSAELSSHLIVSPNKSSLSLSGNVTDFLLNTTQCKSADFHLSMATPSLQQISFTTDLRGLQKGSCYLNRGVLSLSLDTQSQALRLLEARGIGRFNQCAFDLFASGAGQTNGRQGFLTIDRVEGTLGGNHLTLERPLHIEHRGISLSSLSLTLGIGLEGRIVGEWNRTSVLLGTGNLFFDRVPLQHVAQSIGLMEAFGTFDGQLHYQATSRSVMGTAQFQAHLSRLGVIGGPDGGLAIGGTVSLENDIARGEACIAGMGINEPLIISLSTPMQRVLKSPWVTIPRQSPLTGTIKGDFHLSQLLAGWMTANAGFEAIIGCDATVGGTLENPSFSGPFHLREGRIDLLPTGEMISDIQMDGNIENRRLSVYSLSATDDMKGRIRGSGIVEVTDANLFRWEASLDCSDVEVINLDYATVIADATLKLTGDLSSITITGSSKAKRAVIDLAARFPSNIPEINVIYRDEPLHHHSPYNVFFDLSIDASQNLEIKGRGLSSQWDGHLHLGGEAEELAVDGSMHCLNGAFALSTKELTINEGSLVVAGNLFKDSRLNLIANISLPSITAQVCAKGPLEAPKISIQSNPPKPDNEILSLILFNKEYGDISPLQSLQLANTAMTLQHRSGPFDLLDRVKETFGIDLIDFGSSIPSAPVAASPSSGLDDTDTGPPADTQNDVSLKVGKYISDGVAVTVSKNVTSDTNYLGLEAQVAPEVVAGAEVGDDQEGIVSLKWKKNY